MMMKILVLSSSLNPQSRSEELAKICDAQLRKGSEVRFLTLKDYSLQGRDLYAPLQSEDYRQLHQFVSEADGLVLVSPVHNWSCGAELKRFIEIVGTTSPEGTVRGAFFDKVVTFVNTAGVPHSYTAFLETATSMMIDFKCIINPYHVFVTNSDWEEGNLNAAAMARLTKSMSVFLELVCLLKARTYRSDWEI